MFLNVRHTLGVNGQRDSVADTRLGITPRSSANPNQQHDTPAMNTNDIIQITLAGTLFIDISKQSVGERTGAKRPVRYHLSLGGAAANMLRELAPLGLRVNVHSAQHPLFAPWIRHEVCRLGGTPFITERDDALALTVIQESPKDGSDLDVHRPKLRCSDFAETGFAENARRSALTILGPIADAAEAVPLMQETVRAAQRAAMVPHPGVLADPGFGVVAGEMDCIILNRSEAALLAPGYEGPEVPAVRMRHLTEGKPEIIVTDDDRPVVAWADNNWHRKQPRSAGCGRQDKGAGDAFSARYFYYRFVAGLPAGVALDRALDAVAAFLRAAAVGSAAAPGVRAMPRAGVLHSAAKTDRVSRFHQGALAAARACGLFIHL